MEVTDSGKHSSLQWFEITYSRKMFYCTAPGRNPELAGIRSWPESGVGRIERTRGLYYKTLRIRNLRENVRFQNKLVTSNQTNTLLLEQTNTLAYYGVRRLRIRNFL